MDWLVVLFLLGPFAAAEKAQDVSYPELKAELWACEGLDGTEVPAHCADDVNVEIRAPDCKTKAEKIAKDHNLILLGEIKGMPCHFTFSHHPDNSHARARRSVTMSLAEDADVAWAGGDAVKSRPKRGTTLSPSPPVLPFRDPNYVDQWYLHEGANGGYDMWVKGAWAEGYSGRNVSVSILDDGIQPDHPDLAQNYDPLASYDVNDQDSDPTPRDNNDNKHGTRCAGEVAAVAGNDWCGVGVAYNGRIGGVRMLDGPVSDRVEAASLHHNQDHIDVYSASWGPEDDGRTFDGPGPLAKKAFRDGITSGRRGLGNIFIWASGNGGAHADSCSCDGYTTSIYTLSVSSATFDNRKPWYLEECPSTIASTYSSAGAGQPAIVTTDMPNSCTKYHTGTSASAPMAAGLVALALEANPRLTWRDMQHLVLRTADPTALLSNAGWGTNGVGRKVSNKFGYGMMNAHQLVIQAKTWTTVPPQSNCSFEYDTKEPVKLSGMFAMNLTMKVSGCDGVRYLEQLQAVITVRISRRGDLRLTLISPAGTRSVLLPRRPGDANRSGFHKWPFLSVQQWGEDPRGDWTLIVENAGSGRTEGSLHDWSLLVFGTAEPAQPSDPINSGTAPARASTPGGPREEEKPMDGSHPVEGSVLHSGCHAECDGSGCTAVNDAGACVACARLSQRKLNRAGIKCVPSCDTGWWKDVEKKMCLRCMKGCAACDAAEVCTTCEHEMYLVMADFESFHHGTCVDQCPQGFQLYSNDRTCRVDCGIADCGVCGSLNTCAKCQAGLFVASSKAKCVTACASGELADATQGLCHSCPSMCESCRTPDSCERCTIGSQWSAEEKYCKLGGGATVLACPTPCAAEGQFCDRSNWSCGPCHHTCLACVGPIATACTTCRVGDVLEAGRCLSSSTTRSPGTPTTAACPRSQFFDIQLLSCEGCHDSCASCNNHGPGACLSCGPSSVLRNGYCRRCCEDGSTSSDTAEGTAAASIGPHDCVPCGPLRSQVSVGGGGWTRMAVMACVGAVLSFAVLFACLMCREKRSHNYKSLPKFDLDEALHSGSGKRKGEDSDEDDFLYTRTPVR